ncbi:MAG: type transport system permease protein, partial [Solirubrobacteraceae bacterium]|nr:type transport system permease protein [Solirubrobacteraceae bacterium]
MNILRSEFLKLISVRTTWLLLGAMILIEGAVAGLLAGLGEKKDLRPANVPDLLIGTPLSILFVFTLGALISTNEFRHGTANSTFLITPRRERVIAAKLVVGLAVGLVGALLYIAVNAGLGLSILSSRGVDVASNTAVNTYLGVGTGLVLGCLFGVALGASLRNQ